MLAPGPAFVPWASKAGWLWWAQCQHPLGQASVVGEDSKMPGFSFPAWLRLSALESISPVILGNSRYQLSLGFLSVK